MRALPRRKLPFWKRMLIYAIGIALFYLGLCAWLAYKYVHPHRSPVVSLVGARSIGIDPRNPAEAHDSAPALPLVPAYVFDPESSPTAAVVLMHGYGGSPSDWQDVATALAARGALVVVPVAPAHENSNERQVGFGTTEADAIIVAAEWIRARHPELPILAHGISLDGASAWLASARRPDLFAAIGSDGGFADLNEASRAFLGPTAGILAPVIPIASMISGVDADKIRPVDAARAWRGRPALIIHGESDRLFPVRFGETLSEAVGVPLLRVKEGRHAHSIEVLGAEPYAELLLRTLGSEAK